MKGPNRDIPEKTAAITNIIMRNQRHQFLQAFVRSGKNIAIKMRTKKNEVRENSDSSDAEN